MKSSDYTKRTTAEGVAKAIDVTGPRSATPGRSTVPATDADARLAALTEIVRVVGAAADYDTLLTDAARAARMALGGSSVSVSRWERGAGQVRTLVNEGDLAGWERERPTDEVYSIRRDPALTELIVDGRAYVVVAGETSDAATDALLRGADKSSAIDLPIVVEGHVWGDLWVARALGLEPYTTKDLDYGTVVAAQIATAITVGERLARVSRLAYTDPLTGLANRRAVDERLDAAIERHRQVGQPISLLVCDVNGLKLINDEYGHVAGDRALVRLAGVLSAAAALAPGSLAARLGGDEFCIVMDGHDADRAAEVADDLSRQAAGILTHGVSCGVASTDLDVALVRSGGRLFRLADAAQYRAKRSGSLRPVVAGRTAPAELDPTPLSPRPGGQPDRRVVRGRSHTDAAQALADGLSALDDAGAASSQSRVEIVATTLARQVDAAGWWVSVHPADAKFVRTVGLRMFRAGTADTGGGQWLGQSEVGAEFPIDRFPLTRRALTGSGFVVTVDDPMADAAEVAILQGLGAVGVLLAGARSNSDGWLVEVVADEISAPLHALVPVARALLAVALRSTNDAGAARRG